MPSPPKRNHNLNLAFMPTSNDTLYPNVPIDNYPSKNPNPNALPPRQSSSSPSYFSPNLRQNGTSASSSKAASPMSRPPSLPRSQLSRERTAQATQTQTTVTTQPTTQAGTDEEPDPTDEIFWYNLHMETLANFERERTMWRRMTERLTKEVEKVRQELQQTRARAVRGELGQHLSPQSQSQRFSGAGSGAGNNVNILAEEGIQESDKIFLDKQIIDQANARLREISVLSPAKEIGNPFDKPSPTQVDGVTFKRPNTAPSSNQQTREEITRSQSTSTSTRKVTISAADSNTITQTTSLPADLALSTDDSQAQRPQQSPPPHNFIMHAGHTPISVRARIARDSLWSRLAAAQNQNASQHHDDELGVVLNKNASPPNTKPTLPPRKKSPIPNLEGSNDVDGDIPLKSPRMLPTMPSGPSTPDLRQRDDPFAVLASKLEAVANDPKKALPEVLRYTVHVPSDELGVSHGNVNGGKSGLGGERHDGLGEQKGEHHEVNELEDGHEGEGGEDGEEGEEEVGEIVVKTRKSLNFGSQLGKLK